MLKQGDHLHNDHGGDCGDCGDCGDGDDWRHHRQYIEYMDSFNIAIRNRCIEDATDSLRMLYESGFKLPAPLKDIRKIAAPGPKPRWVTYTPPWKQ